MRKTALAALACAAFIAGCQGATIDPGVKTGSIAEDAREKEAPAAGAEQVATPGAEEGAAATVIEAYSPPPTGTVLTWRNNWASLPPLISYKVAGVVRLGETEYVKFTSVSGLKETVNAYYDTKSFALKGYRDAKDRAVVTYKPVEERYRFPMKAGDKWVTAWKSWDHRKERETQGGGVVQVIGFEMLELPAGRFKTVKVRLPTAQGMPAGMTHYLWFAPELGVTVKEQIGNGQMNWTQILEKVERPTS